MFLKEQPPGGDSRRSTGLLQVNTPRRKQMSQLTPEEEEKILASPPKGTFALMLLVGALIFAGWAYMFFFMFLEHGPVK